VNYGASVRPRRSLVGSLNFESVTPSGGQRAVENDGELPPGDGDENWSRGVTGFSPPLTITKLCSRTGQAI